MKIVNVYQGTPEWLDARKGEMTGTKAKGLVLGRYANRYEEMLDKYESCDDQQGPKGRAIYDKVEQERVKYLGRKITADFWQYMAELATLGADFDYETPLQHGHRMEPLNIVATLKKLNINEEECDAEPGLWVSSEYDYMACSPDAHEASLTPTWAIECKSLTTAHHLEAVAPYLLRETLEGATQPEMMEAVDLQKTLYPGQDPTEWRDYDLVPDIYKPQVLQYFVVNRELRTLYFSLYDDRVQWEQWRHCILTITRDSIIHEITTQRDELCETHRIINRLSSLCATDAAPATNAPNA